jgi:FAD/FMN-containing dehydrogenase
MVRAHRHGRGVPWLFSSKLFQEERQLIPAQQLNVADVATLKAQLNGELLTPADRAYPRARRVFNAMIDRRPALIAFCTGPADVVAAVNFARQRQVAIAVRGGGHSVAGHGACDGGLVIDLSRMNRVQVNPDQQTVRVEGGCTLADVDRATHPFGLAVPAGIVSTTGVAGLTLGGGLGHLTRKHGLTIDNLLAVELVLADGSCITAGHTQNEDLFWAVRGGGGNFGIVTAFLFRSHPISTVYGGPMLWHTDRAAAILRFYRDFILSAPREISGFFAFLTVPPGPPFPEHLHLQQMCGVVWCYSGQLDQAEQVFRPIRQSHPPDLDLLGSVPFPAFQSMLDASAPSGMQHYWRADFVIDLSDEAIRTHTRFASRLPTPHSTMHLYPIDGAAHDVGNSETAFSFREANWAQVIIGAAPDPGDSEQIISWTKEYWRALHPYSAGGTYVNFLMDEGAERVQATYRNNYPRLVAVKNRYDPTNLFQLNQNIKPDSSGL